MRSVVVTLSVVLALAPLVASAEPPARRFELSGNELVVPGAIVFETGGAALKPESEAALEHVAAYLADKTYISTLRIEGHTDGDGKPAEQQALSEQRALAVARWLVKKGVDCKRLLPVGFGGSKPVAANDSAEGKAKNRRTSFVNAALRGRAIGGMPLDGGGQVAGDPCAP
ncbi:OmpA family protein [Myxococcota bacterium]|nr:OmpA family protein [Myxococcota bacterium]